MRLLARAIGYELRPGVAAEAELAFEVEDAPGAPGIALVPAGTPVQSVPGQDELPQTFETSAELEASAAWNALRPPDDPTADARAGRDELWLQRHLAGPARGERPAARRARSAAASGAHLSAAGGRASRAVDDERWDFRRITDIQERDGWTLVTLERRVGRRPGSPLTAMEAIEVHTFDAARQRLFGGNAPDPSRSVVHRPPRPTGPRSGRASTVHCAADRRDRARRRPAALRRRLLAPARAQRLPRALPRRGTAARRRGALRGSAARRPTSASTSPRASTVRPPRDDRARRLGTLDADRAPRDDPLTGALLSLAGTDPLPVGAAPRRDRLRARHGAERPARRGRHAAPAGRGRRRSRGATPWARSCRSPSSPPLALSYDRATARVRANVVPPPTARRSRRCSAAATRRVAFQRMRTRRGPLTHVRAATPSGTKSTLEVRVDGVRWEAVASLDGAGPRDRVLRRARPRRTGRST